MLVLVQDAEELFLLLMIYLLQPILDEWNRLNKQCYQAV